MQIIKCKNCGAQLDVTSAADGIAECGYCHSKHILAKSASAEALNFLAMGEHCLDTCKFDDAISAYGKAAQIDPTEPEAYFGTALSEFKVQYIKDIVNNRLQPICHDVSAKKFSQNGNYIKALSLAAPRQKAEYERRAAEIDYIRSEFYKLKKQDRDYDCFICVKVSGENGRKTVDSERANDIYFHLKDRGYKPFYSEREIQNETGADYEARILYALFCSPCMLIVCSDESYLQTPWVKNEYTRFINLINDERKETDSIAIGFFDAPIERLPNRNGRLQGVCLNRPDAYSKITDFIDGLLGTNIQTSLLQRKEYGATTYKKRSAVKSQIQKRELGSFIRTDLSVSEKAKLDVAVSMLKSGNYDATISKCRSVLATNNSCSLAHWYLFLAENRCLDVESIKSGTNRLIAIDSLESAIASGDADMKACCYDVLFARACADKTIELFSEYVTLPDSDPDKIRMLTSVVYKEIVGGRLSEPEDAFDIIIKTVDDTDTFIDMNLGYADMLFGRKAVDRATIYYKRVIETDEGNGHAIWQLFRIKYKIFTSSELAVFLTFKDGQEKTECEAFSYGFNRFAVEQCFDTCLKKYDLGLQYNVARFKFLLSLIPKEENDVFKNYINAVADRMLVNGQFFAASYFNEIILTQNNYDCSAYLRRLYIKYKTVNPFDFAMHEEKLYDDPDFSIAIDAFAEKYGSRQENAFIELVKQFKRYNAASEFIHRVCSGLMLTEKGLSNGASLNIIVKDVLDVLTDAETKKCYEDVVNKITNKYFFSANNIDNDTMSRLKLLDNTSKWLLQRVGDFDFSIAGFDFVWGFIRIFVTDDQIDNAFDYCRREKRLSDEGLLGADDLKTLNNEYWDDFAGILMNGIDFLIDNVIEGRPLDEYKKQNIWNVYYYCRSSKKMTSSLVSKIKSKYTKHNLATTILKERATVYSNFYKKSVKSRLSAVG